MWRSQSEKLIFLLQFVCEGFARMAELDHLFAVS